MKPRLLIIGGYGAFGVVPLPRALLPVSETREYVDAAGRSCFDVKISHALAGFIVRCRGWLEPVPDDDPEAARGPGNDAMTRKTGISAV